MATTTRTRTFRTTVAKVREGDFVMEGMVNGYPVGRRFTVSGTCTVYEGAPGIPALIDLYGMDKGDVWTEMSDTRVWVERTYR